MADRNTPYPEKVMAQLEIQIDEQKLVIKKKHFRLLELEEEKANVARDIEASTSHIKKLEAEMEQQRAIKAKAEE